AMSTLPVRVSFCSRWRLKPWSANGILTAVTAMSWSSTIAGSLARSRASFRGRGDLRGRFSSLLERTWAAALTPAINMDTGYVNLLTPEERGRVLAYTRDHSQGRRFIAGASIEGDGRDPATAYLAQVDTIRAHGGTPILFQCSTLMREDENRVLDVYRQVGKAGGPLLAFELGTMFAPFGRICSEDFIARLLDTEAFVGLKHSSLDRCTEWSRVGLRDRHRPDFRIY